LCGDGGSGGAVPCVGDAGSEGRVPKSKVRNESRGGSFELMPVRVDEFLFFGKLLFVVRDNNLQPFFLVYSKIVFAVLAEELAPPIVVPIVQ
jgi:hypothetical protein